MLRSRFANLLTINHSDSDLQRRGRNLIIIAIGLIMMSLLSLPLVLIQPDPLPQVIPAIFGSLTYVGLIALARSGRVNAAAVGSVFLIVVSLFITPLFTRQIGLVPQFLVIGVLIAAVTARPRVVAATTVAIIGILIIQGIVLADDPQRLAPSNEVLAVGGIIAMIAGLIGALGAQSSTHALEAARQARERAETTAAALDHLNRDLEQRIAERTAALQTALGESQRRTAEQEQLLAENRAQREAIRAMSVPVLPVSDTTLVMPLVGELDAERLETIRETALAAVERNRARRLLIDLTGVPIIDTFVARGLIDVVKGTRLLGSEAVLIGIGPEVAQSLVSLGVNLEDISTVRDLRQALAMRNGLR